ncbi:MAG: metal ABC transporter permease [Actinomycetota bacterium]|jgi:manganese/zinc/iron transport system permease protein|nr:metal ABC transporter permease [Rubrobacter sp.]MDQ3506954.1 metal ABC transporter permease [Actinomycetota bacterium]
MLDLFSALFTDYTLRNVALGCAVLGVVSGVLGCFAVLRRQGLLGDALAHATLPGVCVAFILTGTRTPAILLLGAAISASLGALLILAVVGGTRIKQDAALGIVLSVFFGAGTVMLTYIAGTGNSGQSGLDRFIFGQAATIVREDVVTMGILAGIALVVVAVLFKEFKILSFDPEFAASMGYPVGKLNILLTALIVVAIVIGIQTVGVILMAAMLITPAAAARQWTDKLSMMVFVSGFFGALSGVSGAMVSASGSNLPTGPIIVLAATGIFLLSLVFGARHGFLWSRLRERRNRRAALEGGSP